MSLNLPQTSDEVLCLPDGDIPNTIRSLADRRALSGLMGKLHRDLGSQDDALKRKAKAALRKMGFPED
ncbi:MULTISPECIES: hypothetical protein [Ponticoccus]|uniref:Uncharacterized protein n=1 Tax=Ponticoccus litoralis TaxID=422297 RepID=A0AAW9SNG6_9RHOB